MPISIFGHIVDWESKAESRFPTSWSNSLMLSRSSKIPFLLLAKAKARKVIVEKAESAAYSSTPNFIMST